MEGYRGYTFGKKPLLLTEFVVLESDDHVKDEHEIFENVMDQKITEMIEHQDGADARRELFHSFQQMNMGRRTWLYAKVYSCRKRKCIINAFFSPRGRLWVNGKAVLIQTFDWQKQYYVSADLEKGANHILLEFYSAPGYHSVFLQLLDYRFEMSNDFKALSRMGGLFHLDPVLEVRTDPLFDLEGVTHTLMMFSGSGKYERDYEIDVIDSAVGVVRRGIPARLNEPVTLEVGELRSLSAEPLRNEWIRCRFRKKEGEDSHYDVPLLLTDYRPAAQRLYEEAKTLTWELPGWLEPYHSHLLELHEIYGMAENTLQQLLNAYRIREHLERVKKGLYTPDEWMKPGKRDFYIRSVLDNRIVRIGAYLPADYDPAQVYPALLILATGSEGTYCHELDEKNLPERCLCFDVTGRGFTGGSYAGYASIMEIWRWIGGKFRIDENRVYVIGRSNGGYATYALAQNIPHLAAAISPVIGYPQMKTIRNLSNTPTYTFVSGKDLVFTGHKNEVKNALAAYGNYHQQDYEEMLHHHFNYHHHHRDMLASLFQARRDPFPRHIHFTTQRNRFLESFWVRLHGIAFGRRTAVVEATLASPSHIELRVQGSDGVTLTLPPEADRKSLDIVVNKVRLHVEEYEKRQVILRRGKTWRICAQEPRPDYRKGTGILDVYQDSLRILLPDESPEALRRAAEAFARPHTNGGGGDIAVDYPIYRAGEAPAGIFSHNLIILDSGGGNPYAQRIRNRLWMECGEGGVVCQEQTLTGEYIAMQVVPHPYDDRRSVLYVATNSEGLLGGNLFTRRVVHPYYLNGLHPYWNNVALLHIRGAFYRIYEAGGPLEQI